MKNKISLAIVAVSLAGVVSTAAFGYVLLSPARRWFNADTPRQVNIDNRGVASVTGGDPDNGVTRRRQRGQELEWRRYGDRQLFELGRVPPGRRRQRRHLRRSPSHLYRKLSRRDAHRLLLDFDHRHVRRSHGGQDHRRRRRVQSRVQLHDAGPGSCSSEIYLDSVVAHEVGHVIGLAHSNNSGALMYPTVSYCLDKGVASDDINGRNALYNCTLVEGGGGSCDPAGASCTSNSTCCSNSCKGSPERRPAGNRVKSSGRPSGRPQ